MCSFVGIFGNSRRYSELKLWYARIFKLEKYLLENLEEASTISIS